MTDSLPAPAASEQPPDVFISYSSRDRDRVRPLAELLESEGYRVYWDQYLSAGEDFYHSLESKLEEARAVLVIWSVNSIGSDWVLNEARLAKARDVLVPCTLDTTQQPLDFRHIHVEDISSWSVGKEHPAIQSILRALEHLDIHGRRELESFAVQQTFYDLRIAVGGIVAGLVCSIILGVCAALTIPATSEMGGTATLVAALFGASGCIPVLFRLTTWMTSRVNPTRRTFIGASIGLVAGVVVYSVVGGPLASTNAWTFEWNEEAPEELVSAMYRLFFLHVGVFWVSALTGLTVGWFAGERSAGGTPQARDGLAVSHMFRQNVPVVTVGTGILSLIALSSVLSDLSASQRAALAEVGRDDLAFLVEVPNQALVITILTFCAASFLLAWTSIDEGLRANQRPQRTTLMAGVLLVLAAASFTTVWLLTEGILRVVSVVAMSTIAWGPWSTYRRRAQTVHLAPAEPLLSTAMGAALLLGVVVVAQNAIPIAAGLGATLGLVTEIGDERDSGLEGFRQLLGIAGTSSFVAIAGVSVLFGTAAITGTLVRRHYEGYPIMPRQTVRATRRPGVRVGMAASAVVLTVSMLAVALYYPTRSVDEHREPEDTVTVLAAARDLFPGVEITEADLYTLEVPPRFLPPGVIGTADSVIGSRPAERMLANELVRAERLDGAMSVPDGLAHRVPEGKRAVSVQRASPWDVEKDAHLDVYTSSPAGACELARGAVVLALGPDQRPRQETPGRYSMVLLVDEREALGFASLSHDSRLTIGLRSPLGVESSEVPSCVEVLP
ncbi:MAG: TIR domain-containing protein [Alphaproteobacteria bacterium]|nr:TIR domain-containing protein [Alphaproteobacteria bacterium]